MKRSHSISLAIAVAIAAHPFISEGREAKKTAAPSPSPAAEAATTPAEADPDTAFLQKAAEINLFEIRSGEIASKSSDPVIKKLGQKLSKNHQSAQQQLERLAERKNTPLPKQPTTITLERIAETAKKEGVEFDQTFIQEQIRGHQEAIAFYEREVARTTDPEIRAWGNRMIGGLKANLDHVKETLPEIVAEKRIQKKPARSKQKARKPDLN